MDEEVLIQVNNVSKKFSKNFKKSLYYGIKDVFRGVTGKDKNAELRTDEFWAVRNISFELKRGECLGLIGHNGAGKSTLLKMLNGLIMPDEGEIVMKGKVSAMIELGAGFNPILTGRENVYNNGALLGFSKEEIDNKYQSIIDFSEVGSFIDMPVQNYSSGMKVRLGFAVAAHMNPDVLIIDEVLAVGDMGFIMKCFNAIDKILPNAAVIFVSHSMPLISRICNKIIVVDNGSSIYTSNEIAEGIDIYYSKFPMVPTYSKNDGVKIEEVYINEIECYQSGQTVFVKRLENLKIRAIIFLEDTYDSLDISLVFYDKELRGIAEYINDNKMLLTKRDGLIDFEIFLPKIIFSKGLYSLTITVKDDRRREIIMRAQSVAFFQVISKYNVWTSFQLHGELKQLN